ncbi:Mitochondrial F1F0-ATP synthase subunit epsilon/ATP15 [Klebsormidium nitens]|uniref:Mitochondrial F1F0-ATP synthase subunit epsilon/ATP15 n=1 Tax=Klebsormidium nitens TaxID=105231 RepID=A0A1Y1IJI9_KLENI|nr:Mitochondrial F1F0-ATP synthase subunit epsilon/ATP15 [Klebsormidium nitens]|eukprot:GAQ89281.1 Mitochondrial F1F0-ATP synthase subunit epsilon/ATP15 [Klebsormidium nitens]
MSTAAAAPFWRTAGFTYLRYANTCATMVRSCLKEPYKSQVAAREGYSYKLVKWDNGTQQKAVVHESEAAAH